VIAPSIDPDRMRDACNALHSEIIAACQLGYREASRAGETWLLRGIKRSCESGNIKYLAEYLETLAILLEIDESDLVHTADRCHSLRVAAQRALDAAELLAAEERAA
jgi:hypothetical protein